MLRPVAVALAIVAAGFGGAFAVGRASKKDAPPDPAVRALVKRAEAPSLPNLTSVAPLPALRAAPRTQAQTKTQTTATQTTQTPTQTTPAPTTTAPAQTTPAPTQTQPTQTQTQPPVIEG